MKRTLFGIREYVSGYELFLAMKKFYSVLRPCAGHINIASHSHTSYLYPLREINKLMELQKSTKFVGQQIFQLRKFIRFKCPTHPSLHCVLNAGVMFFFPLFLYMSESVNPDPSSSWAWQLVP